MDQKRKIYCQVCGDVTRGHPEEDKLISEIFGTGFDTEYIEICMYGHKKLKEWCGGCFKANGYKKIKQSRQNMA